MKKLIKIATIPLILLTTAVSAYYSELERLYNSFYLFHPDAIVYNFSNMKEVSTTLHFPESNQSQRLEYALSPLPETFTYKGNKVSIEDFLKETSTTSLLVIKDQTITFEEYYQGTGEYDQRISWSMAKSFISALFGIAVHEGDIPDLNVPVTDYVPILKGSGYDGVSIKNVLQMSSGVRFDEDYNKFTSDINRFSRTWALGGSFDDFAATLETERNQGELLHYVSIDTHVLGMVLRAATKRDIADYFQEKLWGKLNSEKGAYYLTDSTGEPMVLGGLNMITRDYARLGILFRDLGQFAGEQVVPTQWVIDSTTPDAPHIMPGKKDGTDSRWGYGYQWWVPENADEEFLAVGIYDQYMYVNRKLNVVIVKNSAYIDFMENNFESGDMTVAAFRAIAQSLHKPGDG